MKEQSITSLFSWKDPGSFLKQYTVLFVQAQPNSKYKTSMCRDLRQQGGCPRGASCTFAHTQEELEK